MDINCKGGHKVVYTGCNDSQVTYGGHDDPRGLLFIGHGYIVAKTIVHNYNTEVHLKGYEGLEFNSVCFKDEEET